MQTVKLAAMAMATRFELVVGGDEDPAWLRAAGEEALAEVRRLDGRLSFYSESSDVARVNRLAARDAVPVDTALFRLLLDCKRLHQATDGAFDVTVGPLMRCWGFAGQSPARPSLDDLRAVMDGVGMHHVQLDEANRTVSFGVEGVEIDLGGVGKGFAIDEATWLLTEAGVEHAFLHGGTSSMRAWGRSPDGPSWAVAISAPLTRPDGVVSDQVLAVPRLVNRSLGVSDVRGKGFMTATGFAGHVLDPRTGQPVQGAGLAAVEAETAMEADALSTAMLVANPRERQTMIDRFPGIRSLLAGEDHDGTPVVLHSDFPAP
jgi:thiamine biosynthesis lipoprotein